MQSCEQSTMRALLLCSALLLSGTDITLAIDSTGLVVRILDGDTIEVLHNTHPERVRLSGIDCPENGQATCKQAMQAA